MKRPTPLHARVLSEPVKQVYHLSKVPQLEKIHAIKETSVRVRE